ncbi:MAG: hypothetical protein ACR2PH_12635 [Desulfobulbia bacterium]
MKGDLKLLIAFGLSFFLLNTVQVSAQFSKDNHIQLLAARGKGQTTGHIADLSIVNKHKDHRAAVRSQLMFIPGGGRYQSYVGYILPGIILEPGEKLNVPMVGVCVDVHKPPVPDGKELSPLDTWYYTSPDAPFPSSSFFGTGDPSDDGNLLDDVKGVTERINEAAQRVNDILNDPNEEEIDESLAELMSKLQKLIDKRQNEKPDTNKGNDLPPVDPWPAEPPSNSHKIPQDIQDRLKNGYSLKLEETLMQMESERQGKPILSKADSSEAILFTSIDVAGYIAELGKLIAEDASEEVEKESSREKASKGAAGTAKEGEKEAKTALEELKEAIKAANAAKEAARKAFEEAKDAYDLAREAAAYARRLALDGAKKDKDGKLAKQAQEAQEASDAAHKAYEEAKAAYEEFIGKDEKKDEAPPKEDDKDKPEKHVPGSGTYPGSPINPESPAFQIIIKKDKKGNLLVDPVRPEDSDSLSYANDPDAYALNMIQAVSAIVIKTDSMLLTGEIHTPFSSAPEKEEESIVQQTTWIYSAALSGVPYQKEDFKETVYKQYADKQEIAVAGIDEEVKDKLDPGIDDFWGTFVAVGAEAKVISVE